RLTSIGAKQTPGPHGVEYLNLKMFRTSMRWNSRSGTSSQFFASTLPRRWDSHGLGDFGNCAARDIKSGVAKLLHNGIVRQNVRGAFIIDHLTNSVTDRLG